MRAARFHGREDIRIEDVPEPVLCQGKVLVAVEWCGICGSDVTEYVAGPTRAFPKQGKGEVHPLTGENIPTTMGHEVCGKIAAIMPGSLFKIGQAVMVDPRLCCRKCVPCQQDVDHCCGNLGFLGFSGISGGFSSTMLVEERMVHRIPDTVGLEYAALIEPLVVVHHAIKTTGIVEWSCLDVLVVGAGPVGIAMALALKAHRVGRVIVSEPTVARRKQVSQYSDVIINPLEEDVGHRCRSITGGLGVHVAFDCAGTTKGLEAAFASLRFKGTFVNIAVWGKPMTVPFADFMLKDITMKGSVVYDDADFAEVMQMLAEGQFVGLRNLVTARIRLEDLVEKGIQELLNNKDEHIKILVTPKVEIVS